MTRRAAIGNSNVKSPADATDKSITSRLPQLVEVLLNLAVGIYAEKQEKDDGVTYRVPPNRLAAEYLINRVLGRAAEKAARSEPESSEEIALTHADLRSMSTNELVELHRKSIGACQPGRK